MVSDELCAHASTLWQLSRVAFATGVFMFVRHKSSTRDAGGHYTAYCRNAGDDQWYIFNDERVKRVNSHEVAGPEAYVLYYEQLGADGKP